MGFSSEFKFPCDARSMSCVGRSDTSVGINLPTVSGQMASVYVDLHKAVMVLFGWSPDTSIWERLMSLHLPVPQFPCLQKEVGGYHLPLPSTMSPTDVKAMDEQGQVNRGVYVAFPSSFVFNFQSTLCSN